ncbi:MAG: hypothetical protein GWP07_01320 [Xanthomonadaceae bacterium]|nr:hypothetical protein [Xanthomonadaceae bacterium]
MDIAKVKGIGPASVKIMAEHGLHSVEDIVAGGVEKLLVIPGFSSIRAARISEEAKILLAAEMPAAQKLEKIVEGKKMKGGKAKKKSKKSGKKKSKKKSGKSKKKEKAAKREKRKKQKGKKKAKKSAAKR